MDINDDTSLTQEEKESKANGLIIDEEQDQKPGIVLKFILSMKKRTGLELKDAELLFRLK